MRWNVLALLTELKAARDREWRLANYDELTRLPNRRLFEERLSEAVAHASRFNQIFAVLFIDLDRFKPVNDSFGHDTGDILLRSVAQRLTDTVRNEDVVARLSGDEFVVLLRTLQRAEDSAIVATKLIDSIKAPFLLNGREVFVGASVGIAIFPIDGSHNNELIRFADLAMYQVKRVQGNGFRFYSDQLGQQATIRMNLESDLRQALVENELMVYFQPIVAVLTGRVVAFEALVRWQHQQEGLLGPSTFIPLAEETDLILGLDAWVLRQACEQCQQWCLKNDTGAGCSVNVNLSARHFQQPEKLIALVRECLQASNLPPQQLELEVTESALIEQPELAAQSLSELRALGVGIALDDFGVGYSSLSYLRNLPLDTLKIDKTFLQQMSDDARSTALVAAILQLGRTLELSVVAEGVETFEQFAWLRDQGDCLVQGFFIARPTPEPVFSVSLPQIG